MFTNFNSLIEVLFLNNILLRYFRWGDTGDNEIAFSGDIENSEKSLLEGGVSGEFYTSSSEKLNLFYFYYCYEIGELLLLISLELLLLLFFLFFFF